MGFLDEDSFKHAGKTTGTFYLLQPSIIYERSSLKFGKKIIKCMVTLMNCNIKVFLIGFLHWLRVCLRGKYPVKLTKL